ncbi:hypothetical protein ACHAPD_005002 [Fusarium lateritium]
MPLGFWKAHQARVLRCVSPGRGGNETKPNQNLPETDVIIGEFSFDDAFTFGQDIGAEIPDKSSALLLKEIAEGVKKAIAKVGM